MHGGNRKRIADMSEGIAKLPCLGHEEALRSVVIIRCDAAGIDEERFRASASCHVDPATAQACHFMRTWQMGGAYAGGPMKPGGEREDTAIAANG